MKHVIHLHQFKSPPSELHANSNIYFYFVFHPKQLLNQGKKNQIRLKSTTSSNADCIIDS